MKKIILKVVGALSVAAGMLPAVRAGVEAGGDIVQHVEASYSPLTAVATGVNAKATVAVNEIAGNVKAGGDIKQTAIQKYSPVSAVATGLNAKAAARVNSVRSSTD